MPLAIIAMVLVGATSIYFTSLGNVILQLESAPEMRGRVMALWTVGFLGSTPIGGPIIGWIGDTFGPRWGLGVGGIAALAAAGIGLLSLQAAKRKKVSVALGVRDKQTQAGQMRYK